jgi:hypothetical protein
MELVSYLGLSTLSWSGNTKNAIRTANKHAEVRNINCLCRSSIMRLYAQDCMEWIEDHEDRSTSSGFAIKIQGAAY